ncbi:hypothetical protein [Laspinema olomoucense]|uniref:Uncharacterized protein n=1 Tax=Laspinema olomoucense D3b TaxID=2953688 RepID=A0ABT2NE58_9CYAN|nr:hypothetical protein [Laspinema sp. D3b]MCT7980983.1 hypothetical protein [Laspinema sp. D3b]
MSPMTPDESEKIAQLIASLPSDRLLEQCQTPQQQVEWHNSRTNQQMIAEGWQAKFSGRLLDDSIADACDRGKISPHKHDLINLRVNLYREQWQLIKIAHPHIQAWHQAIYQQTQKHPKFFHVLPFWHKLFSPGFKAPYPFVTPWELFSKTLEEEVNAPIEWSLEPYYVVPVKKWRTATGLLKEQFENLNEDGSYPEQKPSTGDKLKNQIVYDKVTFSWFGFTLFVCQFVTLKNPTIRQQYIAFNRTLAEYYKMGIRASRSVRGFAWQKGEQVPTTQHGGTYRK